MHVMLKRAAASAIPVLLGLAVFPATAMAAPHAFPVLGGSADGIISFCAGSKIIGNSVYATSGSGIDNSRGGTFGNGVVGIAGNSLEAHAVAAGRP
jgi:hypothetical protein